MTGEYTFSLAAENVYSISLILPTGKNYFFIFSLSHLFIFQKIKSLLKNEKKTDSNSHFSLILGSICLCRPKTGKSQLGPAHRARRPHPGRNLGLGRQCRAGALARLAAGWPIQSRPSVLIRRPSAHLAEYKPRRRTPPSKP